MNPSPEDPSLAHVEWRLTQLETQVKQGFDVVERRFDRLGSNIERLAFVPRELYDSEKAAQDKRMTELESRQTWTLGLLISSLVIALAAGLVRLAIG